MLSPIIKFQPLTGGLEKSQVLESIGQKVPVSKKYRALQSPKQKRYIEYKCYLPILKNSR